jgi:hypothetical protein
MKGLRQSSSFSDMSTSRGGAEFWSFEDGSELSGSKSLIEVLRRSWTNTPAGLGLDETLVWKACRRRCCYCVGEGPIRRTREGGSEWEPIKILLEGDEKLQQDEHGFQHTSPTHYQGWSSPRSHWSATGPRNQHTTFQPEKRSGKTKPRVYRPTPVRPVSTTGQTGPCW